MLFNIIILVLEVLYYSLFMKFARKEGKFWRYFLLFTLISIIFSFISTKELYSYLLLILTILLGLKYIVKIKTTIYDGLISIMMLMLKLVIEFSIYVLFYKILNFNHFFTAILFEIIKICVIMLIRNKLNILYLKFKHIWDNNNFYIRYLFTIFMYSYVIITFLLLISNFKK